MKIINDMKRLLIFIIVSVMSSVTIAGSFNGKSRDYGYRNMSDSYMQNDIAIGKTNLLGNILRRILTKSWADRKKITVTKFFCGNER